MAIGRNFADHAKELGNSVPSKPFYFLKPIASYLPAGSGRAIWIPSGCEVHHEGSCCTAEHHHAQTNFIMKSIYLFLVLPFFSAVELAVVIGSRAVDVRASDAHKHISGYALALDMTARNLQNEAKTAGLPWSRAKGYDTFTPVGRFLPKSLVADPQNVRLALSVNGVVRQSGTTANMIFR